VDGKKIPRGQTRINGHMHFDTNSERQKTIHSQITVNVEQPIHLAPRSVFFYASKQGKSRTMKLTLSSVSKTDFDISAVKTDLDFITAKVVQDEGSNKHLTITLSDKAPVGKFTGKVTLKTSLDAQPEVMIPIRGSVL
jgi:hypothetical protein